MSGGSGSVQVGRAELYSKMARDLDERGAAFLKGGETSQSLTLSDLFDTADDGAVVPRLKVRAFFTSPVSCSSRWLTCSWLWLRLSVSSRRRKIRLPETVEIDTVCREKFEIGDMRSVRDSVSLN